MSDLSWAVLLVLVVVLFYLRERRIERENRALVDTVAGALRELVAAGREPPPDVGVGVSGYVTAGPEREPPS